MIRLKHFGLALVAELAIAATLSVDSVYLGRDYFNDNFGPALLLFRNRQAFLI